MSNLEKKLQKLDIFDHSTVKYPTQTQMIHILTHNFDPRFMEDFTNQEFHTLFILHWENSYSDFLKNANLERTLFGDAKKRDLFHVENVLNDLELKIKYLEKIFKATPDQNDGSLNEKQKAKKLFVHWILKTQFFKNEDHYEHTQKEFSKDLLKNNPNLVNKPDQLNELKAYSILKAYYLYQYYHYSAYQYLMKEKTLKGMHPTIFNFIAESYSYLFKNRTGFLKDESQNIRIVQNRSLPASFVLYHLGIDIFKISKANPLIIEDLEKDKNSSHFKLKLEENKTLNSNNVVNNSNEESGNRNIKVTSLSQIDQLTFHAASEQYINSLQKQSAIYLLYTEKAQFSFTFGNNPQKTISSRTYRERSDDYKDFNQHQPYKMHLTFDLNEDHRTFWRYYIFFYHVYEGLKEGEYIKLVDHDKSAGSLSFSFIYKPLQKNTNNEDVTFHKTKSDDHIESFAIGQIVGHFPRYEKEKTFENYQLDMSHSEKPKTPQKAVEKFSFSVCKKVDIGGKQTEKTIYTLPDLWVTY